MPQPTNLNIAADINSSTDNGAEKEKGKTILVE